MDKDLPEKKKIFAKTRCVSYFTSEPKITYDNSQQTKSAKHSQPRLKKEKQTEKEQRKDGIHVTDVPGAAISSHWDFPPINQSIRLLYQRF